MGNVTINSLVVHQWLCKSRVYSINVNSFPKAHPKPKNNGWPQICRISFKLFKHNSHEKERVYLNRGKVFILVDVNYMQI